MKILILGLSSFYGSNFAKCVIAHGDTPIAPAKEWRLGDDLPPVKFDCVVNFASASLVAESWQDPIAWLMTNTVKTTAMINQLVHCQRFIHVSTPEVYGHNAGVVREGHPFNPSTPYAVSRAAADMMINAYHRAYGFPSIITRTANIYGLGQPDYRFIPHAFKTLREGKKLYLDGGGKTIRGWIHVKDACEATYLLCKEGKIGETYHIAPRGIQTVESLAALICNQLGRDIEKHLGSRNERLGKDLAYILDSTKIRNLGWSDNITLQEGLAEYGH